MASFTSFYELVNRNWLDSNPLPSDKSRWGVFDELSDNNLEKTRTLCETDSGMVGQLYRKYLEQPKNIADSTLNLLKQIDTISTHAEFWQQCGQLLPQGVSVLFHICKSSDDKSPNWQLPCISQAGLGLPKDYYTAPTKEEICQKYRQYIEDLTRAHGYKVNADDIFKFERRKAELHWAPTEQRQTDLVYNPLAWDTVQTYCPDFWATNPQLNLHHNRVWADTVSPQETVLVENPKLMEGLQELVEATPISVLKNLLLFKVADHWAFCQPDSIVELAFNFHGKTMNGQKEMEPVWKRSLKRVNRLIGDEVGKAWAEQYFPEERRQQCSNMIKLLIDSLRETLTQVDWWAEETRDAALCKLETFKPRVGTPDRYHTIDGLWLKNGFLAIPEHQADVLLEWSKWDWRVNELNQMYMPTDKAVWYMTPHLVNAYYSPNDNEIVFPAGILQPPFFGFETLEENLGAIGVVIGHEMTHGFDDQGRKFNELGQLQEWWTEADCQEFDFRAQRIKNHYASKVFFGKNLDGELTLGENIADIGGLKLALGALKRSGRPLTKEIYDRFFRTYAHVWAANISQEFAHMLLTLDPHSPGRWRVDAALAHIPEFYQTYNIGADHPMYLPPEQRMNIW